MTNTTCRYCKGNLKAEAVFCKECNHFQNWRRFLAIGSSTLALLIALISVATVFYSTVYDRFFFEEDVRVTGDGNALKVYNMSEKTILLNNYWTIKTEGGKNEFICQFNNGSFLLDPISEENYKLTGNTKCSKRNLTHLTFLKLLQQITDIGRQEKEVDCTFELKYTISKQSETIPPIPCRVILF